MSSEKGGVPNHPQIPEGAPPAYSQAAPGFAPPPQAGYPQAGYGAPVGQPYYPAPQTGQPGYYQPPHGTNMNVQYVVAPSAQTMATGPPPPDYFNRAIFVTLCCFWPTGILAIMKASDARSALARGDYLTANNSAQSARQMINISIIVGIISIVAACMLIGVYVGVMSNAYSYD